MSTAPATIAIWLRGPARAVMHRELVAYRDRLGLGWRVMAGPLEAGARERERWFDSAAERPGPLVAIGNIGWNDIPEPVEPRTMLITFRPARPQARLGVVGPDDAAIGELAARHLVESGYGRAAYVLRLRDPRDPHDARRIRHEGFHAAIAAALGAGAVEQLPPGDSPADTRRILRSWVDGGRGRPALFSFQDRAALWLLNELDRAGVAVPAQAGVVGAEDTDICSTMDPPLSSVRIPWAIIASEAAVVAHRMLSGSHPGPEIRIRPVSVAVRASTCAMASSDELPARLRALVDSRFADPELDVAELGRRLQLAPRQLHRRCVAALGLSPKRLLTTVRMTQARRLLAGGSVSIGDVASRCGYADRETFVRAFREAHGVPPSRWRAVRGDDAG